LLTFVIYSLLRILCERPVRPKNPSAHGSASMQIAAPPRLWVSATVIIASTTLGLVGTTSLLGSERLLIIAGWGGFVGLGAIVVMRIFARALERDLDHLATSLNQEMFRAPTDPLPSRRRDRNLQFRETTELQQAFTRSSTQVARTNVKRFVEIERAKEAERLKSQFLANMSHDLRAPLNSILGFSDLLLRGIDGELSAGHVEMLELIQTNGETLLREIDEILDYAKIEAARLSLHREPTAVGMLLEGALHRTRERLKRSIRCACEIDPDLPPVFIDPLRTAQALEHLLSFAAVELPEDRSLAIRVLPYKTPTDPLIVEIRTPNKPAAMADIGRLRHGFFRIRGHAGLGLGLPIAAAIIDMQGGRLDIAERGEAMTFTVTLHGPNHQLTPRPDLAEKIGWGATSPHA
jgi:signal transduction histidine kinase